ncbi:MAG: hypothetical protein HLX51_00800 [Micrococcaceae bacterium]|nr:hypothetical protein [Micrococcaceae bacterium]
MSENTAFQNQPLEHHEANAKVFIEALRDRISWPAVLVTYRETLVGETNHIAFWGIHPGSTVRTLSFALNDRPDTPEIIVNQITLPQDLAESAGFSRLQQQLETFNSVTGHDVLEFDWFSGIGEVFHDLERYIAEATKRLQQHLSTLGDGPR